MRLNQKIREVRLAKNMKQAELAKNLGITVQSYSMKEAGRRPITTDELQIIANTLNISVGDLFE